MDRIEVGFFPGTQTHVFTQVGDWSIYIPMSHQANRMYNILRSLINEKDPESFCTTSDDFLRAAMGMAGGTKPLSKTTLYRIRTELVDLDMVRVETIHDRTNLRGQPRITSRRYLVRRDPHTDRPHVRSSWDLRRRFSELEEKGLSPAEMNTFSDLNSTLLGNTFSDLNNGVSDLKNQTGSDLRRGASSNKPSPKKPLPPPPPSTRLAARRGRGSARRTEETKIKDFSHTHLKAAEALVCGLPGSITGTDRKVLVRLVCAAFDGGWSPSGLTEHLRANCDLERVKFPGRVYVKHAGQDLPPAGRDEPVRAQRELCQVCDEQGFTEEVSACSKDPQAVPGMCLHGQPDPWDDETYRTERETERAEALYALQRAQEEARDRKTRIQRAQAQEAARRAEAKARRRREAAEFLATADSLGDEVADEVRRALLEADDPAALEDLEDLVSFGIGFVESGGSMPELRVVLARTERESWRTVLLDRSTVAA